MRRVNGGNNDVFVMLLGKGVKQALRNPRDRKRRRGKEQRSDVGVYWCMGVECMVYGLSD